MNFFLESFENEFLESIRQKSLKAEPLTSHDIEKLTQAEKEARTHSDARLHQLRMIARMMQVVGQDETNGNIGSVDFYDMATLGFFLEEEFKTLEKLSDIREDAGHYLQNQKAMANVSKQEQPHLNN